MIDCIVEKIKIVDVKKLLESGKTVKVKTINNEYTKITEYIDKGFIITYLVILENDKSIKVSGTHKFFTNSGWISTNNLEINKHAILCDDNSYSLVKSISSIGRHKIVDISVEHPEKCYFGNGILNHNTGKSLLAAHILANTQKKDGIAIYLDSEMAVSREFLSAIGIDLSKLLYIPFDTIEDMFDIIESLIIKIRESNRDKIVTIVADSIAAASTKDEIAGGYDKEGYNTGKSILLSKGLRKITPLIGKQKICLVFTNQLRTKLGVMFGDPSITPGGKALGFHASVRIRLKQAGQLKRKTAIKEDVIGIKTIANVIKNKVGPPLRSTEFNIMFDSGIDDYGGWLTTLKAYNLINQGGAWYTITYNNEEKKFQSKDWYEMLKNEEFKNYVYELLCNSIIMKYKDHTIVDQENIIVDNKEIE